MTSKLNETLRIAAQQREYLQQVPTAAVLAVDEEIAATNAVAPALIEPVNPCKRRVLIADEKVQVVDPNEKHFVSPKQN